MLNCRSLKNKIFDLEAEVTDDLGNPLFQIIMLTETWFTEDVADNIFSPFFKKHYTILRSDRLRGEGGGVAILIRYSINFYQISQPANAHFEHLVLHLFFSAFKPLVLSVFYRKPGSDFESAQQISQVVSSLSTGSSSVICGDFNFPGINWLSHHADDGLRSSGIFCDAIVANSLVQHVTEPTHVRGNILDLVFGSPDVQIDSVHTRSTHMSDHLGVSFCIPGSVSSAEVVARPNFSRANFVMLERYLANIYWPAIFSTCVNINDFWLSFTEIINHAISLYVPFSAPRLSKSQVSKRTRSCITDRRRHVKKHGNFSSKIKELNRKIRLSRRQDQALVESKILSVKKSKPFWNFVNARLKCSSSLGALKDDLGNLILDDFQKASAFNKKFQSVFCKDDGVLPSFPSRATAFPCINPAFSGSEVYRKLLARPLKIVCGPDGIPPLFLKKLALVLAEPLATIFTFSYHSGTIPDQWKHARVIPLHKGKGSKANVANYRPISLTVDACKSMESSIKEAIVDFIEKNSLLCTSQHGFRKGKSTVTNLVETLHEWLSALDQGLEHDVIYLDIAKAFDSVSHTKLLYKLRKFGLPNGIVAWVSAFLDGRTQSTVVNNVESESVAVTSGVPQGSVLGPVLFLIYINDLQKCVLHSSVQIFADDTKIFMTGSADNQKLQDDLDRIQRWCVTWQLNLSADKCAAFKVKRNSRANNALVPAYSFKIGNSELPFVDTVRDLGVEISSPFSFRHHYTQIVLSANRMANAIHRSFSLKSKFFLRDLFCTYVRPKLEYASPCWNPYLVKDINLLESVQRRFTKRIPGLRSLSYENRLRVLGIPTLERRRLQLDMVTFYKIVNGSFTTNLKSCIRDSPAPSRGHPCRKMVIRANSDLYKFSFIPRCIPIWNSLPAEVVAASNASVFSNRLSNTVSVNKYLRGGIGPGADPALLLW